MNFCANARANIATNAYKVSTTLAPRPDIYLNELCHQLLIYVKTSGSIYEHHIVSVLLGVFNACLSDLYGRDLSSH